MDTSNRSLHHRKDLLLISIYSGAGFNVGNTIFPDTQHIPADSFLNFNAWKYWYSLFVSPIVILKCDKYSISG